MQDDEANGKIIYILYTLSLLIFRGCVDFTDGKYLTTHHKFGVVLNLNSTLGDS